MMCSWWNLRNNANAGEMTWSANEKQLNEFRSKDHAIEGSKRLG
jgi:hypothetical protein